MIRYIVSRLAFSFIVLFALSAFVFLLFYVAPGDPARLIAGSKATEETLVRIRENLGLDLPIYQQYLNFLSSALHGDLGFSYRNQQPVLDLIVSRIPPTVSLVLGGVIVWLAIGIPIGVASAKRPGSMADRLGQGFTLIGLSIPTFVLGMVMLYVLYFMPRQAGFTLFPAGGYVDVWQDPIGWAWHMTLPWLTVALVNAAIYARLTRGQMLEVLGEDYIRTARAKGLSERRVVYKHGMRSSVAPLTTQLGGDIGYLLAGSIVIEQVFGLQGVGALAIQSVATQDRPIIIGVVLLGGVFMIASNILVDLVAVALNPKLRGR